MSKRSLGLLALLCTSFFWGFGPVITKIGLGEIPAFSFAFMRNILAFLILLPFLFGMKHHWISKSDIPRFIAVGIFGSGLNALFFMSGLSLTNASTSAAIFATVPLVNAIAASFILRETPSVVRILGVGVGFLGSLMITLGPSFLGTAVTGNTIGNLLIFGAVLSWVTYIIVSKELLAKYSPLTLTAYLFLVSSIMLAPFAYYDFVTQPNWIMKVHWQGVAAICYGAIFAGILAYVFFQWGMKQTSAFTAGIFTYLQPPLAALFAIPVLGEKPTPILILGTVLILGGVFLATTYEMIQNRRNNF